ncbi:MAG: SDR family oxidoreductase [Clostridiales bacterium]|jgi:short-subunit dehydrogenase|nr:SDR family oxidoreductase [Clostridiales bacterium]
MVVLITGASAGIGKAAAELFLSKGCIVYNISRSGSDVSGIHNICADVSDPLKVFEAVESVYAAQKRIDVLVNCAGFGISGSVENTSPDNMQKIFAVNFLGTAYMCRSVIPIMRGQNGGMIINVGSVAGRIPIPFQAFYSATKAAVGSFGQALRSEVKPFGIRVTSILPGDVKTEFTARREKNPLDDKAYGDRIERSVKKMEKDEQNGLPASLIAAQIFRLSRRKNPPLGVIGGKAYSLLLFLSRFLPERTVSFLIGKLYG